MRLQFLLCFLYLLNLQAQVVINEFSAANYDDFDFQAGPGTNYADWIELYNTGSSSVDLSGYHLSDKLTNTQKWTIPAGTTIAAGGHLVFLADGRDNFSAGNYHTNFKLTQTKGTEYIVFADASGNIIESIPLNYPNKKNESRGRKSDGASTWGILENPTPNTANNTNKDRYALKPIFSQTPGFYTSSVLLTLTTTEASSTIRYTTDGSTPTASSTAYTSPINISSTTVIRAATFSSNPNIFSSHIETNTYFINANHTTKVISIAGGGALNSLLGGNQINPEGSLELFETDGSFLTESTGEFNKHGNDSWAYAQRGLDFVARDQFGTNYALLDEIFDNKNRDEYQRVILKCGASDNYPFEGQANNNYFGEFGGAHIRDAYINEMSQLGELRLDERSNEFAVMYVNGQYWGIYDIREKVDDHDFTSYYYDQERDELQYLKTWGTTWAEYGGNQAINDWDALVNFITNNDMTIPTNYDYVDSVFNTGSLIDYFILNGFVVNADWLNWNTSWWRGLNPNGNKKKWRYTLWDMDATFNHYTNYSGVPSQSANSDPCNPDDLPNLGGQGHVPIWNALKENDDFFADYANRYAELSSTVFSCDSMHNLLDSMVAEISGEMPAHITRWGGSLSEWQENVDSLHAFINTRCANVVTGLVSCDSSLTGPFELTVLVDPPGSGKVQLSSVTPANYPFVASYFGGVDINISADPNQCWEFDYWTIENDTIFPNNNTANIQFDLSANDTLTVHYTPTNCIYIDVQPSGAGLVTVDGNVLNNYPNIESLTDSINHTFDVVANNNFSFNHWDWNIHSPLPSNTSTNTVVYTYTNDTVIAYFDQMISDSVTYIVNPAGAGSITVDGNAISTFPSTEYYAQSSNSSIVAIANTAYTFDSWSFTNNTPSPNNTSASINTTWTSNDTVIVNFTAIPTNDITYIVNPVGAGSIMVDGTNISTFPSTNTYNSSSTSNLLAIANTGYSFVNWSTNSNSVNPNNNTNNISITWNNDDTIIINFAAIPTFDITYMVNPTNAGSIEANGTTINNFPNTISYNINTNIVLNAISNPNYSFDFWSANNSVLNPNSNAIASNFNVVADDTITAYFETYITDTLWIITNPPNTAELLVGSDLISSSPFMGIYEVGEVLNIEANPINTNIFNQWSLSGNALPDFNTNTYFIFNGQDTLYAYLNNVLGIQNLGKDIEEIKVYPTLAKSNITVEINAKEKSVLNLNIYNTTGQKVKTLDNTRLDAQEIYSKTFDVSNLTKGIYLLKIESSKTSTLQKFVIVE